MPEEVPATVCAEVRRAAKRGERFMDLAGKYDIQYATVARHVRGECDHRIPEPPAPLE